MILMFQKWALKTRLIGVLVTFFLVFCAFYAYTSTPWLLVQLRQYAPEATLPDQAFWYTPAEAHTLLGSWGVVGRDFFRTVLFPFDMGFPVLYTAFLFLALLYLLKKVNPRVVWLYLLPILPLVGGFLDWLENGAVFAMTWIYPDRWEVLGWAAATFTAGKWSLLTLSLGTLTVLVFVHWVQRLKALMTPAP